MQVHKATYPCWTTARASARKSTLCFWCQQAACQDTKDSSQMLVVSFYLRSEISFLVFFFFHRNHWKGSFTKIIHCTCHSCHGKALRNVAHSGPECPAVRASRQGLTSFPQVSVLKLQFLIFVSGRMYRQSLPTGLGWVALRVRNRSQVPRAVGNSKPDHPPGTSDKHRPAYGKKGRGKNFRKLKSVSLSCY